MILMKILGFSAGSYTFIGPMYIAETAEAHWDMFEFDAFYCIGTTQDDHA